MDILQYMLVAQHVLHKNSNSRGRDPTTHLIALNPSTDNCQTVIFNTHHINAEQTNVKMN